MANNKWEKLGPSIPHVLDDPFMMGPLLAAVSGIECVQVRNTETGEVREVVVDTLNNQDLGDAIAKGQFTDKDRQS